MLGFSVGVVVDCWFVVVLVVWVGGLVFVVICRLFFGVASDSLFGLVVVGCVVLVGAGSLVFGWVGGCGVGGSWLRYVGGLGWVVAGCCCGFVVGWCWLGLGCLTVLAVFFVVGLVGGRGWSLVAFVVFLLSLFLCFLNCCVFVLFLFFLWGGGLVGVVVLVV